MLVHWHFCRYKLFNMLINAERAYCRYLRCNSITGTCPSWPRNCKFNDMQLLINCFFCFFFIWHLQKKSNTQTHFIKFIIHWRKCMVVMSCFCRWFGLHFHSRSPSAAIFYYVKILWDGWKCKKTQLKSDFALPQIIPCRTILI